MENKEPITAPRIGKIKFVNEKARFGFIIDQETQEEFYFKTGDLTTGSEANANTLYLFEITHRKRGFQAINLKPSKE